MRRRTNVTKDEYTNTLDKTMLFFVLWLLQNATFSWATFVTSDDHMCHCISLSFCSPLSLVSSLTCCFFSGRIYSNLLSSKRFFYINKSRQKYLTSMSLSFGFIFFLLRFTASNFSILFSSFSLSLSAHIQVYEKCIHITLRLRHLPKADG